MSTYTWKIESVNLDTGSMEVSYTHEDNETRLNLPMPEAGADVAKFIDGYAPRTQWQHQQITVEVGSTGEAPVETIMDESPDLELPNTIGSWQEEYIRAMIYSVLEEVRESSV